MQSGDTLRERLKEGGMGRRMSSIGLLLLCISFFLPFPPIYPPRVYRHVDPVTGAVTITICHPWPSQERTYMSPAAVAFGEYHTVDSFCRLFLLFVVGFQAGLLYLLALVIRRSGPRRFLKGSLWVICAVFLLCLAVWAAFASSNTLAQYAYGQGATGTPHEEANLTVWGDPALILLAIPLVAAFGCGAILFARRPLRQPLGVFLFGLVNLPLFILVHFIVDDFRPHVGPFVSVSGLALIAIGGLWEAIAASRACRAESLPTPHP
ncbi:hypothetical protein LCGC14_0205180 [marine sediment metagenome]|uniref:Uncharacterized protein n=1 Tax=marine sediment metagenome TaxID=412755 RepID=A0A0F9UHU2_9ZZZZ|nr:hypothetical protein [Phycisphaerae bacterium]HDZ43326.1 hypothetical protein [Phycisphaerae bacterium]